jgi:hypothetical protein
MKLGICIALAIVLSSSTALGGPNPGGTLVIPTTIDAVPTPFAAEQPVTFSASFSAPFRCAFSGGTIGIRIYNKDENGAAPQQKDPYLVQAGSDFTFATAPGAKASATFDPVRVPATAAAAINVAVFRFCLVPNPHGIDAHGASSTAIINATDVLMSLIGGEFYYRHCMGTIAARVCTYSKPRTHQH